MNDNPFSLSSSAADDKQPTAAGLSQRFDSVRIVDALGAGACIPDAAFDQFLPETMRRLSAQHWTPLAVAARAAQWFDEYNIRSVVDVGSGSGKFCVAAALACGCHFTGVEHRGRLVTHARDLARTFGVASRTYFIHGAVGEVRLPSVDAYYLYNPFEEDILPPNQRIDGDIALSRERSRCDAEAVRSLLARAPVGTYALVYNGFGESVPQAYRKVRVDRELPNVLCLWRKSATRMLSRPQQTGLGGCLGAA
jgi:hypothetical protein